MIGDGNVEREKIWTKDFITICLSNFFVSLNFYLLMTTMAVYAMHQFHVAESHAGLAASIFIFGALVARLFAGKFIDIVGRKKMIYAGLVLFLIGSISYSFVTNIGWLLAIRLLHGIGFGIATTALSTVNMSTLPAARRGEGISYFSLSTAAGTAVGPFLALYLTEHFTYETMFIICIGFSASALICALFTSISEIQLTTAQK